MFRMQSAIFDENNKMTTTKDKEELEKQLDDNVVSVICGIFFF